VCHHVSDEPAQFVRYAKSLSLHIEMRTDSIGSIYAPYLEIDYQSVSRHNITRTAASVSRQFIIALMISAAVLIFIVNYLVISRYFICTLSISARKI